jgi:hypothetical protein
VARGEAGSVTLSVATRVRLRHDVDRFPHFIAEAGEWGTVVHTPESDSAGTLCVRMDAPIAGAEEWDNEVVWSVIDGDDPERDLEVPPVALHTADCTARTSREDLVRDLKADPRNRYLLGALIEYDAGGDQDAEVCDCREQRSTIYRAIE